MRKFTLILLQSLIVFLTNAENTYAQQVDRNYDVVEIGTGTWCGYCPGAAMGADDLVHNGHQVAIIENHNGDSYTNAGSNARNAYNGVSGYPTATFDGANNLSGGSATVSMYGAYAPICDTALSVMSDFTIDMSYTFNGLDYDVTIDIDEPGDYVGTNLVVQLALTESHIPENWGILHELNFVNRAMYPSHTGTSYTGDTTTLNLSFTADANWDLANCELVAFIQDNSTKKVLQADKTTLAQPTNTNNVNLIDLVEIPDDCFGVITPNILVKNLGSEDITSLTIDYSINSGAGIGTLNWVANRPIPFYEYAKIPLDEIIIDLLPTNSIDIEIMYVNGVIDEDISDNTATGNFNEAPGSVNNIVNLELHTDSWGSECSWNIKDYSGTIIESGGPYGNNQTINETFTLPGADCYSFSIIDSFGDGGGMVKLTDDNNDTLYYTNGSYGGGETQAFKTPGAGAGTNDIAFGNSIIYPNPANTELNIDNAEGLSISLFDILGRNLITKENITSATQINVADLAEGTYILKLSDGVKIRTEKIVIAR